MCDVHLCGVQVNIAGSCLYMSICMHGTQKWCSQWIYHGTYPLNSNKCSPRLAIQFLTYDKLVRRLLPFFPTAAMILRTRNELFEWCTKVVKTGHTCALGSKLSSIDKWRRTPALWIWWVGIRSNTDDVSIFGGLLLVGGCKCSILCNRPTCIIWNSEWSNLHRIPLTSQCICSWPSEFPRMAAT